MESAFVMSCLNLKGISLHSESVKPLTVKNSMKMDQKHFVTKFVFCPFVNDNIHVFSSHKVVDLMNAIFDHKCLNKHISGVINTENLIQDIKAQCVIQL